MQFPFWVTLIVVVVRLAIIFVLLTLIPAILIRLFHKELSIWTACAVAVLCIVMPALSFSNTTIAVQNFYDTFQVWGVDGSTFRILSWAFTIGANISSIYAGYILWRSRPVDQTQVQCFAWLALLLHLVSMLVVPMLLFGDYVYSAFYDQEADIFVYVILIAMVSLYLRRSKNCRTLYQNNFC